MNDANGHVGEMPSEEDRAQLASELDQLIERVQKLTPEFQPPPFSPRRMIELLEENIEQFAPEVRLSILEKLRSGIGKDFLDIDTWKGLWVMLNYTLEYQVDLFKRRTTGDYTVDEWGLDQDILAAVRPFFEFMYKI
jgi:hypothetical protein